MPSSIGAGLPGAVAARFETTQWSLVVAAGQGRSPTAEQALARLGALYWYPVFAFVRRKGHAPEGAQDLLASDRVRAMFRLPDRLEEP
jgi:hypothetical protein